MISKWVKDLSKAIVNGKSDDGKTPDEIVEKIDKLLKKSMHSTDDENLSDDIRKEINGDN